MRLNTAIGDDLSSADRPTNILCGLMQFAAERGTDCNAWFAGTGLQPEGISNPDTRISYRQASTVIRRALAALAWAWCWVAARTWATSACSGWR